MSILLMSALQQTAYVNNSISLVRVQTPALLEHDLEVVRKNIKGMIRVRLCEPYALQYFENIVESMTVDYDSNSMAGISPVVEIRPYIQAASRILEQNG